MDTALIREINTLWLDVYPGLARQVADYCGNPPRKILEVGCFSGGTGFELLKLFPRSSLTIALEIEELVRSFSEDWKDQIFSFLASRYCVVSTPLHPMNLPDASFDLVFCRGVFFFLAEKGAILSEMYRVLAPGGIVFAGGGFGKYTGKDIIDSIADESRRLNFALGKKVVSHQELRRLLEKNGLADTTDIVEEGGFWAVIKKTVL